MMLFLSVVLFSTHTHGSHFADELEGREYVLGEMWKGELPFGLVMNKTMSDDIA